MANIETMKINLAKNEEKLAKKIALLAKYETKKAKFSAQWEKLYNESFLDSMKKIYELEEDNLSIYGNYGKIIKYYGEKGYDIYDKLYYLTRDEDYWNPINQTKEGIKELEERCQKYRDSIAEEEKKNADRIASMNAHTTSINGKDVNVIVEFLNNWEKEVTTYWMKRFEYFENEHESYYKEVVESSLEYMITYSSYKNKDKIVEMWTTSEYVKFYPTYEEYNKNANYRDECRGFIRSALNGMIEEYESRFSIKQIEKWGKSKWSLKKEVFEENMRKDIAKEKNRKYDKLIEDVESICGKIIDMSHIKVGYTKNLEGYVIGEKGECELWTSIAGGFNENVIVNVKHGQIAHFRFYVKRRI